jgi:hypothetical protein
MIRSWGYKLRENAGCILLLIVLPVSVFAPSLFQGKVPFAPEGILSLPPWESVEVPPTARPEAALSTWQLNTSWPSYRYISEHGKVLGDLLWNPDAGLGQPFAANAANRCYSPFSVPFYLLEMGFAWTISLCLKLIVSGCVAFYVARRYGFTAGYALIVALVCQWSGPVFVWGAEPMGDVLPWFPLAVLATDRLILGQFWAWPKLAVAVALMAVGGDFRVLAVLLAVLAIYLVLRRVRDAHHVRLRAALPGYLIGLAVGLGLAAPQLLPYLTLLREGTTASGAYPWPISSSLLLGLFGPGYFQAVTGMVNPLAHLVYIGLTPVLLVGIWLALRRYVEKPLRHRVESLALAALVAAAIPFLAQDLLPRLPLLRLIQPAHYLAVLAFPIALLSAGASETWLHLNADECKRVLVRLAFTLPFVWGGLVVACIAFGLSGVGDMPWGTLAGLLILMIVLAVLFGYTLLHPKPRVMAGSVVGLLLVAICWGRFPELVQTDHALIFPETRIVKALQSVGTRVGGTAGLRAWPLNGNGIPVLFAQGTVTLHRTSRFLAQVDENPLLQRRAGVGSLLLQRSDIQGPYAAVRSDLNIVDVFDSGAVLFRDLSTTSPFRIVHEVRDSSEPDLPPLGLDSVPVAEGFAMPRREGPFQDTIRLRDVPRHTEIPLEVETNQPGMLIVAAAWYPGWRAWVDGKETPVHPVDGIFQGIELMSGKHEVDLRFEPSDFRNGFFVFVGSAILAIFGVARALRSTPRHH